VKDSSSISRAPATLFLRLSSFYVNPPSLCSSLLVSKLGAYVSEEWLRMADVGAEAEAK